MRTIAFYTLGCKVNQSDTASMEKLFTQSGYKVVDFTEPADVYLINTCVVTNMGQSKSRKIIHRAARKAGSPLIVVTGCYPQTAPEEVAAIEGVDLIIGTQDRKNIVELVAKAGGHKVSGAANLVHELIKDSPFEEMTAGVDAKMTRAFLKIQEGCNQFCAYCIIPYARGPLRSRALTSITAEVEQLVAQGYKEVVLIGIHLGAYGKEQANGPKLADAVKAALKVQGLARLRLGSLESIEVDQDLLKLMAEDKRFCRHLHLPLQAGADKTLQAMHRPYDSAKFKDLLANIRRQIPDISITTDLIVGFPGETQEDFANSLQFAKVCQFAKIHVFPYSRRKGTPAAAREDQVPEEVKNERVQAAEQIDQAGHQAYLEAMAGRQTEVLWETRNKAGFWEGLTGNYVRVYTESQENLTDQITAVQLQNLFEDGLRGVIIREHDN